VNKKLKKLTKLSWDDAYTTAAALRNIVEHVIRGGGKSAGWSGHPARLIAIEKKLTAMNIGFAGGTFALTDAVTSTKVRLVIEVRRPKGVTDKQLADYVRGAIRQWAKGGDIDDPLYDLTDDDICVFTCQKRRFT
jgi:hypothetical protein